jgi:hypothetical protein
MVQGYGVDDCPTSLVKSRILRHAGVVVKLVIPCVLFAAALTFSAVALATHERPGSATPTSVALVPAFTACTAPNTMHTPPISGFGASCTPPSPRSTVLTMGTLGAGAGRVKFSVFCTDSAPVPCANPGEQEDVLVRLTLRDVRCAAPLGPGLCDIDNDYLGQVMLGVPVRITDHANGDPAASCPVPKGDPPCVTATVQDIPLLAVSGCVAKPSPTLGAACNLQTTMNALTPGMVVEGQITVYEAGSILVLDPGTDGDLGAGCPPTCGTGDERPFMAQGWFTP